MEINALSRTPEVKDWLISSRQPRLLHIFENVCNLINERRNILSIVTLAIGDGPFNLVIDENIVFSKYLDIAAPVSVSADALAIGDLNIFTSAAKIWSPRPDWALLQSRKNRILDQLVSLSTLCSPSSLPAWLISTFINSIITGDVSACLAAVKKLAGLGIGLTPAGDDFILGSLYAAWIIHPPESASVLGGKIANFAAPLTTSLSAAWLRSAGRGEAGILWHEFLDALIASDDRRAYETGKRIAAVGATSGCDALTGFIDVLLKI